jgi:hypothetical protein
MLMIALSRGFWGSGIVAPWGFTAMISVALAGGLLHAKFDFPLQIYSVLFVFVLLCAIMFCLSRRVRRDGSARV